MEWNLAAVNGKRVAVPFLQQIIKAPAYLLASVARMYTTIAPPELRAKKMRFPIKSLIAIGTFMLAGCSNDDAATIVPVEQAPTVFAKVQALHASPDGPLVNVMVDGVVIATADYMDASAEGAGPPGTHSISVDAIMPGASIELFAGMDELLDADTVTTVIVSGPFDELAANVYVQDDTAVAAGSARVFLVHADANVGYVDVYVTAPDADLDASAPFAEDIGYEDAVDPTELAAGVYEITVMEYGETDSDYQLFNAFATLDDGDDLTVVIVPNWQYDYFGGAPITLVAMDANGASELHDADTEALISLTYLSPDAGPVDIEDDGGNLPPVFLGYPGTTCVMPVTAGDYSLSLEQEGPVFGPDDLSFDAASYSALIYDGLAADLALNVLHDDNRSVASYSKQRFYHGSPSIGDVDIYIVLEGTDITAEDPTVEGLAFRDSTGYLLFDEDYYDLVVTATGEKDELAVYADEWLGNYYVSSWFIGDDEEGGTDYIFDYLPEMFPFCDD